MILGAVGLEIIVAVIELELFEIHPDMFLDLTEKLPPDLM